MQKNILEFLSSVTHVLRFDVGGKMKKQSRNVLNTLASSIVTNLDSSFLLPRTAIFHTLNCFHIRKSTKTDREHTMLYKRWS